MNVVNLPNFKGMAFHQMDDKCRVRIPSKFLPVQENGTELGEKDDSSGIKFSLLVGAQGCISVYPQEVLEAKLGLRMQGDPADIEEARARRKVRASIEDVVTDKQGRIVVPPHLRVAASLGKELVSIGMGDHFEMWAKENYEKDDKEMSFEAAFSKLGIFF